MKASTAPRGSTTHTTLPPIPVPGVAVILQTKPSRSSTICRIIRALTAVHRTGRLAFRQATLHLYMDQLASHRATVPLPLATYISSTRKRTMLLPRLTGKRRSMPRQNPTCTTLTVGRHHQQYLTTRHRSSRTRVTPPPGATLRSRSTSTSHTRSTRL